jgi:hypothetical protein
LIVYVFVVVQGIRQSYPALVSKLRCRRDGLAGDNRSKRSTPAKTILEPSL